MPNLPPPQIKETPLSAEDMSPSSWPRLECWWLPQPTIRMLAVRSLPHIATQPPPLGLGWQQAQHRPSHSRRKGTGVSCYTFPSREHTFTTRPFLSSPPVQLHLTLPDVNKAQVRQAVDMSWPNLPPAFRDETEAQRGWEPPRVMVRG